MAMYIVTPQVVKDLLALTADEEVSTFEVTKLQDQLPSLRWRSTSVCPFIQGQFDKARTIDHWSLWYTNSDIGGFFRLRLADTQPELLTNPVVDFYDYVFPSIAGTAGKFFGALRFTGTGDVDYGNILDQTTGSFSYQFRIRRTTTSTTQLVFTKKQNSAASTAGFYFEIRNTDGPRALIADGVTRVQTQPGGNPVPTDRFETYTVVVDRTADELLLYAGIALIGGPEDISAVGSLTNTKDLLLAADGVGNMGTVDIDELRFWSKALVANDLIAGGIADVTQELDVLNLDSGLELYSRFNDCEAVVATDESGNGNDGVITNGPLINVSNFTTLLEPDLSKFDHIHGRGIISNPVESSFFRMDFNFNGNVDGFVQIGNLVLEDQDDRFIISNRHVTGWSPAMFARGVNNIELMAGGLDKGGGEFKVGATVACNGMLRAELWDGLLPLLRGRAGIKVVGAVLNDQYKDFPQSVMYFGYLTAEVVEFGFKAEVQLTIVEP